MSGRSLGLQSQPGLIPGRSRTAAIIRGLRSDRRAVVSLGFLLVLCGVAVLAPVVAPYMPDEQNLNDTLVGPSMTHLLGTDDLGRDTLSRLIWAARSSLYASVLAVSIAVVIGVPVGLAAGLGGRWVDIGISRTIDALLSFPAITLAVGVTGVLGVGLTHGMIAVGITFSPQLARLVRARTLVVRRDLYVDAAKVYGASSLRIALRHVLPNAIPPVIVQITLLLAGALLAEASLSFLGLGVQPPVASWGAMLARAYNYMDVAPAQMYPPGIAILLTALAFNALGESLRTLLDPTASRT